MLNKNVEQWLFDPIIGKFVASVLSIVIIVSFVRFFQKTISTRIKDTDTRYRTRKFVSFIGYFIGIIILVTIFSDKLRGFTVALGVAGAGIAFALQELIASIAGWFAISFAHFYKTGDRVELGGIVGDVIDIGILRTTIMEVGEWVNGDLYNGRVVRVANSFVFKEPVFNYSGEFPFLWDEIVIPIRYGSDHQIAQQLFTQIAQEVIGNYTEQASQAWKKMVRKFLIEDAQVQPMVHLFLKDSWIEFTIRYVVDYKKRRSTKDILFKRVLEEVAKPENNVILGVQSLEITGVQPFAVKLQKG